MLSDRQLNDIDSPIPFAARETRQFLPENLNPESLFSERGLGETALLAQKSGFPQKYVNRNNPRDKQELLRLKVLQSLRFFGKIKDGERCYAMAVHSPRAASGLKSLHIQRALLKNSRCFLT